MGAMLLLWRHCQGEEKKSKFLLLLDLTVTRLAELNRNPLWQIAPHRGRNVVYLPSILVKR